ncbi:MAG: hypothetical protein A2W98_14185 [Bacteroidetes bacterium GWF2_33_38]|nr:MAG: hypothetical protein A2W98_14185 [Bacteroidetes bacterium GWF2_33_38]OFY85348.1 MAG: hypothetical protein A2236_06885 [Bacteroidetes bacterium RIFOXYA2_FULL_33_7]
MIFLLTFVLTTYSQVSTHGDSLITTIDSLKKDSLKTNIPTPSAPNENSIDAPIDYNARDSILFDAVEKKMYLHGDAKIVYKDIELKAEYIELDLSNSTVYAIGVPDSTGKKIGSPSFKEGKEEFKSDNMKYNYRTKRGLINGVITEQSGGYLHSERTKKQANEEIHIKRGKYTTCNLDHPHFYIGLTKAKVIPDDKIVSGPAYLVIEDVTLPFGIPFGFFPNKSGNSSGVIIPEYGEEANRGFFLRNGGYYFAINDYADLSLTADIYSKGSWGAGMHTNYKKRYKFDGNIDFQYERVRIGLPESSNFQQKNIYWLKWKHNQDKKARPYSNFSASVDFGKSNYGKYSTFTSPAAYLKNTAQSSISYSKSFARLPINFSANLRHTQSTINDTTTMMNLSLPEFAMNVSRQFPFKRKHKVGKTRFYEKIGVSYSANMKNTVKVEEKELFQPDIFEKFDNGIKHYVSSSTQMKMLKYLTLSPTANYTERWYFNYLDKYWDYTYLNADSVTYGKLITDTIKGFNRVYDYTFSASLNTKIYGMFTFKSKRLQAIRHVLTPNISYNIRPDFGEDKYDYYRKYYNGNNAFVTYSPYENGMYGQPPSGKMGSLRLSLGNNLEMKVLSPKDTTNTPKKVQIFESLNFSTSYNIVADSLNWSPVNITGGTTLFKTLRLRYGGTVDPYALDSLGNMTNKFTWQVDSSRFGRLTSANASLSFSLRSKSTGTKDKEKTDMLFDYPNGYVDFDIPWNVSFDYNFRYNKSKFEPTINQTISVRGELKLTPKWKIEVSTGYDIKNKDFSYTKVDIYRDLHCWEMRFTWIPFGFRQSYNFQINVKSSILQDLKLNKRSDWSDNF